jgi:hypothetical protein
MERISSRETGLESPGGHQRFFKTSNLRMDPVQSWLNYERTRNGWPCRKTEDVMKVKGIKQGICNKIKV